MPIISPRPLSGDNHYFIKCDVCRENITSVTSPENVVDAVELCGGECSQETTSENAVIICAGCLQKEKK